MPGLMLLMSSLQMHLRFLDAVITEASLPLQPLPLAGQAAGCGGGDGDVALAAGGASAGGWEWAGAARQAQSCPDAQGGCWAWLNAGYQGLSPECKPWRSVYLLMELLSVRVLGWG